MCIFPLQAAESHLQVLAMLVRTRFGLQPQSLRRQRRKQVKLQRLCLRFILFRFGTRAALYVETFLSPCLVQTFVDRVVWRMLMPSHLGPATCPHVEGFIPVSAERQHDDAAVHLGAGSRPSPAYVLDPWRTWPPSALALVFCLNGHLDTQPYCWV